MTGRPRLAVPEDIPDIVEMGRRFHAMSPHNWLADYDGEAVGRMLAVMIASPDQVVITNGFGMIGGVMAPVYFNPSVRIMEEAFWWADKGGMELLSAFEAVAKAMGAAGVYLSTLANERSKVIDRVVSRTGYGIMEFRYIKELL